MYALILGTYTFVRFIQNFNILIKVYYMKLHENLCDDSHLRTCRRTNVTKLIVAFRFEIAQSRPMDATSSLQEFISSFHIYLRPQRWGLCFIVPWHIVLNLSSDSYVLPQSVVEIAFLSFIFIGHPLYTFIAIILNKIN